MRRGITKALYWPLEERRIVGGVWSPGRWRLSQVFKDKEDTDQWGKEGEDVHRTADSMNECSHRDERQVQVFWEKGSKWICSIWEKGVWYDGGGSWRVIVCWRQ